MKEEDKGLPLKKTEVFHRPNPYDLIAISATFDDRTITPPPKTYFPATNPEQQLRTVTIDLKEAFGNDLLFVGLSGSRALYPNKIGADLDVLAVVNDNASGDKVSLEGDLKIVSYTGLREFIECGYQLITTQFRKARPIFEKEGVLDELRPLKPIPEKAIPFLLTKSKFNEQTADIFRLTSSKYRAVFLHQQGFQDEAFSQLIGVGHDDLFKSLLQDLDTVNPNVYAMLAKFYASIGLNRMFHSLSEMTQALHIKETGDVADVEQLVEWVLERTRESGNLLRLLYEKRIACYKKGELLLDVEYDMMRKGIREKNRLIEGIILNN